MYICICRQKLTGFPLQGICRILCTYTDIDTTSEQYIAFNETVPGEMWKLCGSNFYFRTISTVEFQKESDIFPVQTHKRSVQLLQAIFRSLSFFHRRPPAFHFHLHQSSAINQAVASQHSGGFIFFIPSFFQFLPQL